MKINRRQFLKGSAALAALPYIGGKIHSQESLNPTKTVVHIFLEGGPDLRHLLAPQPGTDYGNAFWKARSSLFNITENDSDGYLQAFNENYDLVTSGIHTFGVFKKAGWLRDKIEAGKVAIINNVVGSDSRDHPFSTLVWTSGDHDALPQELCRSGWGGRLAKYANKRILSLTEQPLLFCNGPHPTNPLNHANPNMVDAPSMENFSFTKKDEWFSNPDFIEPEHAVFRSLQHYYRSKRSTIQSGERFSTFVETEEILRSLGDLVEDRLRNGINPSGGFITSVEDEFHSFGARRPVGFEALVRGENRAFLESFARQVMNAYYGIACQDILDVNVISMMMEGFDTHGFQRDEEEGIEVRLEELFGPERGLSLLDAQLLADYSAAHANLIYVLGGEFGRQLKSNGGLGTDHGQGNTLLIIGEQVKGGIYGELFPETEIPLMVDWNQNIEGKTSFERVFAKVAEWACPGSGIQVFPSHSQRILEDGNTLDLFI